MCSHTADPRMAISPILAYVIPRGPSHRGFCQDKEVIDKSDLVVHPGKSGANLFKGVPNANFLALRLDFESPRTT